MGVQKSKVDVIIPVYRPGKRLFQLLEKLAEQTVLPEKVYLMNVETGWEEDTSKELQKRIYHYFGRHKLFGHKLPLKLEIITVKEKNFDQGGTRNLGAERSRSPFLLFMKQDAVPADNQLIEELLWSMESGAGIAMARQIVGISANVLKAYTNLYDYPSQSFLRTAEDIKVYGARTFRVSNVCAMYRRDIFAEQGGFAENMIACEGSLFAARMLKDGGKLAYCAEAKVYYSENSNWMAQLRRKFDEGVAHAEHTKVFSAKGEGQDGWKYGKAVLSYLINQKYYMQVVEFAGENIYKLVGYFLGKHNHWLKKEWIVRLTGNWWYWR